MNSGIKKQSVLCFLLVPATLIASALPVAAIEAERLRIQRKEVFDFTQKPVVTRAGDKVTVSFAVKDFCDATVAIVDERGRIVRHLASGVLGGNAPEPFRKDSLKQTVVWDGKDEIGRYIDDKDSLVVRVSLGLRARMERTLYWSPHKLVDGSPILLAPAPEGVYGFFKGLGDQLRLFDHDGYYVRTLYPFPREHLQAVRGLKWQTYPPDDERLPSKLNDTNQDTLFPSEGFAAVTVGKDHVYLIGNTVARIAKPGSGKTTMLNGPSLNIEQEWRKREFSYAPHAAALSPDGRWLFLTAYRGKGAHTGWYDLPADYLPCVTRMPADLSKPPEIIVGSMTLDRSRKPSEPPPGSVLANPTAIACDKAGRLYVTDLARDALFVFSPDGKLLSRADVDWAMRVQVAPQTGEIWAMGWRLRTAWTLLRDRRIKPWEGMKPREWKTVLHRFPPYKEGAPLKAAQRVLIPAGRRINQDWSHEAVVDVFHSEPRVWFSHANDRANRRTSCLLPSVQIFRVESRKVSAVRRFLEDASGALADPRPVRFGRPRLWVNPANNRLYQGLMTHPTVVACKSFYQVVVIDPETGANHIEQMPTDPEDLGFDWEGRAYLRTFNAISRFDTRTWREVPFDYGDERKVNHGQGGGGERPYDAASAITLPSVIGGMFHMGGMGVAPDGTVAVSCINPKHSGIDSRVKPKNVHGNVASKPYMPPIYPGRNPGWETHIFDKHGKLVQADVTPGIGVSNYLQIDREGYVYILCAGTPYLDGKKYFNGRGCTLIKLKPGKMKCLTPGGIIKLPKAQWPKRPYDMTRPNMWVEGAEWLFGPVGADRHYGSGGKCSCYVNGRFALDYYGRSFAPEVDRFRVVVLDTNGNVVLRIGRYGNVDDGLPLVVPDPSLAGKQGRQPPNPRSIGGDEVAIMHCMNLAVHTDNRLFLADIGNQCIRSVKLGYHAEETMVLKEAK